MEPLDRSWQRAWRNLGLPAPASLKSRLINAYSEPSRQYHSLQHLLECITHLEPVIHLAHHPGEVEISLWFHDAIYDPKAKDNELRSGQWASDALIDKGASPVQAQRVRSLILATRHQSTPTEPDQQLIVDIDLAILGASPARFAEYDAQVKAEYLWVPNVIYRRQRQAVLQAFLDRDPLYRTAHFRHQYEQPAKANLQGAIQSR